MAKKSKNAAAAAAEPPAKKSKNAPRNASQCDAVPTLFQACVPSNGYGCHQPELMSAHTRQRDQIQDNQILPG